MDNREGAIISIITNTNNRFTCYGKKVCINLTNSIYICMFNLLNKRNIRADSITNAVKLYN